MNKKSKNRSILAHLFDLLLVVLIGDFVNLLFNPNLESYLKFLPWNSLYSLIIGGFLWKGNELLGNLIAKKVDSQKYPIRSLRWSLISMLVYTSLAIVVINYFWWIHVIGYPNNFLQTFEGMLIMLIEFVITIIISSILFSRTYFNAWRELAVNEERLKSESLAHQYKALQNQVNPHFLFNSLNTLSSLVYKDQDQAVKFIKQLSEVYRYVLEHKDAELVDISTELAFVKNYVFLQKIRHENSLNIAYNISSVENAQVVPMSLQMLIENCIKHNIVSEDNPLHIDVSLNQEYVAVKNNLQPKSSVEDTGGIGLQNLKTRYELLSDNPILIEETKTEFIVSIPVLKAKTT